MTILCHLIKQMNINLYVLYKSGGVTQQNSFFIV